MTEPQTKWHPDQQDDEILMGWIFEKHFEASHYKTKRLGDEQRDTRFGEEFIWFVKVSEIQARIDKLKARQAKKPSAQRAYYIDLFIGWVTHQSVPEFNRIERNSIITQTNG